MYPADVDANCNDRALDEREGEFKLNIECNHATLSKHSCFHELETARISGWLGNIDANTGNSQSGWDTDQFLVDIGEATLVMLSVVKNLERVQILKTYSLLISLEPWLEGSAMLRNLLDFFNEFLCQVGDRMSWFASDMQVLTQKLEPCLRVKKLILRT
ncbi:uncharacterized protein [Aristolochia californica]|uniref:uncharacterized protein n=1 Tax=Aristolochia californica TaxID=171875 RepID=UPI0035E04A29